MSYIHHVRFLAIVASFVALIAGTTPTHAELPQPFVEHSKVVPMEAPNLCTAQSFDDHSGPSSVQRLATIGGESATVAVAGTRAYIGEGSSVTILDVSQPTRPVRIGSFQVPSYVHTVHLQGNLAYVSSEKGGLTIFDVSNPLRVRFLGFYKPEAGISYEIKVVGSYAYMTVTGDGATGLHIIDVRDPTNPRFVALQRTRSFAFDVDIEDDIAYVTTGYGGDKVEAIDISDPLQPRIVGGANYMAAYEAAGVDVVGNRAYVAFGSFGFTILNIPDMHNGTNYKSLGVISFVELPATTKDIFVEGNYAYVTRYDGYLNIFDITDERNPMMVGGFDTPNQSWEVQVSGGLVYLADGEGGLRIINPSDPTRPTLVAHYRVSSPNNVHIVSGKAYVAGGYGGLEIIDVSRPAYPVRLSRYATLDLASDVSVVGYRAYITNSGLPGVNVGDPFTGSGLEIVDVSNPANPRRLGRIGPLMGASSVQVTRNFAYVTSYEGLSVIDVSNPANPREVRRLFRRSEVQSRTPVFVLIRGSRAYVGFDTMRSVILDITNPANPTLVGNDQQVSSKRIDVEGSTAYYVNEAINIADISNPASPRQLCRISSLGAEDIDVVGSLAYVGTQEHGFVVLDVANPSNVREVGWFDVPTQASEVDVENGLIYYASKEGGLNVMYYRRP